MKVRHFDDVSWVRSGSSHRDEVVDEIKYMLKGERGHKQNYELMMTRNLSRTASPPHRHNFEQIRYCFEGNFGDGKRHQVKEGEVGYYPEGVTYTIDCEHSQVMLIQFAGPSGESYTNHDQVAEVFPEIAAQGEFKGGIFYRDPERDFPEGTKMRQDGFEAVWEHINQRPIVYPRGRYKAPIQIRAEAMAWLPIEGQPNCSTRLLGAFSERSIEISQYRVQDGAELTVEGAPAPRILVVVAGEGDLGEERMRLRSVAACDAGEGFTLRGSPDITILSILLPYFTDDELQSAPLQMPEGA